jgi:hypothetical protein
MNINGYSVGKNGATMAKGLFNSSITLLDGFF